MGILSRAARRTTYSGWNMVLATVFGALFGWWWDRPALVRDAAVENPLEKRAQISAAVFWPTLAVWLAVGTPNCPEWVSSLALGLGVAVLSPLSWTILVSLFATVVLMRRAMASTGRGWPLERLTRDYRTWVTFYPWLFVPFLFATVVTPLYWLTGERDEYMSMHSVPVLTLMGVGLVVTMLEVSWSGKMDRLRPSLAQAHGVTESVMGERGAKGAVSRGSARFTPAKGSGFLMVKVPAQVVSHIDSLDEGIATHLPEFEAKVNRNDAHKITSISYSPVGAEAMEQRDVQRATGGLVLSLTIVPNPHPARPSEHVATLSSKAGKTMAADVDARLEGLGFTVVEWLPSKGVAHVACLDADTYAARKRLASLLGCEPHLIEIEIAYAHDEKLERERIETVTVLRAPSKGTNAERRTETWRDLVQTLPDGSSGWKIAEDLVTGVVVLTYGQPRTLPIMIKMDSLLPHAIDTHNWSRLLLGLDPAGEPATIDLTNGPHTLVVGPTGSGKSAFLRQQAASALAHGHQLVIIDAIKDGIDFVSFRPWCVAFGDDGIEKARTIIEAVYAEGMRRKALQKAHAAPSWLDLPAAVRRAENVVPLTVMFDEFMSAVIPNAVPKGLDKEDPLLLEANQINGDKAVILAMVGKIARELRFTGIFLVIAMQRPDASLLSGFGEIRSNLTSAIQLIKPGSLPAQETLRMVFPGDQTQVAAETIMELDDGMSKGMATIAAEGGDVVGFRVGYGEPDEIPDLLEDLHIPRPAQWTLEAREATPVAGEVITPNVAPVTWGRREKPVVAAETEAEMVVELDSFELSLDDLDDDDDANVEAAPGAAQGDTQRVEDFDFEPLTPVAAPRPVVSDDWDFESLAPVAAPVAAPRPALSDDWDDEPVLTPSAPSVPDDLFD